MFVLVSVLFALSLSSLVLHQKPKRYNLMVNIPINKPIKTLDLLKRIKLPVGTFLHIRDFCVFQIRRENFQHIISKKLAFYSNSHSKVYLYTGISPNFVKMVHTKNQYQTEIFIGITVEDVETVKRLGQNMNVDQE